jgi:peptidyl-prolyl cis-trans isomerase SurA
MKKLIKLSLLILLGVITLKSFAADIPLDKVIVIVNDSVITQSEINKAMQTAKRQLAHSNTPLPSDAELRKQVIDGLIARNIQRGMVQRAGISVSDSELNNAISNIAQRNHMTLLQLKQAVESSGLNYAEYRKNTREQMEFARLQQQEISPNINVTDREVDDFLHNYKEVQNAEYHLKDILIPLSDTPSPKELHRAEQQAQKILQQLKQGANFNQLAAAQSKGRQALKGGNLGWKKLAEMPIIFADQVRHMKTDQVAGPLRAPNGYHIIKVTGIRSSKAKLTRDQIRQLIYQRKFEEKLQSWLQQLRAGAYVKFV